MTKTLLLWDIDGTLLDTAGAGVIPFRLAIEKHLGSKVDFDRQKMAGKTDYQIIESLCRESQLKHPSLIAEHRILRDYTAGLRRNLNLTPVKVLGDSCNTLRNFNTNGSYELGILTGNCKEGMRIKLESAKFTKFFPKNIFYASRLLRSREDILRMAQVRLNRRMILIGDTPSDILAAKNLLIPIISLSRLLAA